MYPWYKILRILLKPNPIINQSVIRIIKTNEWFYHVSLTIKSFMMVWEAFCWSEPAFCLAIQSCSKNQSGHDWFVCNINSWAWQLLFLSQSVSLQPMSRFALEMDAILQSVSLRYTGCHVMARHSSIWLPDSNCMTQIKN